MDLAQVEELLELMHRYGCIQARVDGVELTLDPSRPMPADLSAEAPKLEEKSVISGEEKREVQVNPLLRHKSLGLGKLFDAEPGAKRIA